MMLIFCIIQRRAHGRIPRAALRWRALAARPWSRLAGTSSPGDTDEWIRLSATTCLSCMPREKRS